MKGLRTAPSDLLKIFVKMGASWSAQDFRQAGVTPSGPGAFFLSWSSDRTQIVYLLLILHSAGGWCLVTGNVFHNLSTLKQNHWILSLSE